MTGQTQAANRRAAQDGSHSRHALVSLRERAMDKARPPLYV
jgi:hypothetical protein